MAWHRRTSDLLWIAVLLVWICLTTSWHCTGRFHHWLPFTAPHFQLLHHSSLVTSPATSSPPQYSNDSLPALVDGSEVHPFDEHLQLPHPSNVTDGAIDHDRYSSRQSDETHEPEQHVYKNSRSKYGPSKTCASVEEMGAATAGNTVVSSLRFRRIIEKYVFEHGAIHVRGLPAKEFCSRGFVYGRAGEDGLGNDMYRILTAAGLGIMLNRSIIIAEHGSTNPAYFGRTGHIRLPFGDYLKYSNQTFSLSEVKWLWVKHNCTGEFHRPLVIQIDDFQKPARTNVFCENWTTWKHPIVWFKGTTDSNALQFFLKNRHSTMRSLAALLFGDTTKPDSRPNVFGELFKAFISPMPVIDEAVQWALRNAPDPDLSVHLRMLNSRSKAPSYSMSNCIRTVVHNMLGESSPHVVVVTDTPSIIRHIEAQLDDFAKVMHFDYLSYAYTYRNLSNVMKMNHFQPPEKRIRDWGSMPRWVAIVDLFLASRAKNAVISGANRRVGTTYAQLLAALAAAMRTGTGDGQQGSAGFNFYSSFQPSLLLEGLEGQRGWGHTWRRFGGHLSCKNQTFQCARTPLLPYAWWDGPWQSPVPRDIQRMLAYGVQISSSGEVDVDNLNKRCKKRKAPYEILQLSLPSCKNLKLCL